MNPRYGCVCFAVPRNLLEHLAENSTGAHRELLRAQAAPAAKLRGQRAARSTAAAPGTPGKQPLHRRIFDAQHQTFLPGHLLRDEGGAAVSDRQADDAYDNIGIALQFFKTVLGRDSLDGHGMGVDTSVHYDKQFANALWTGAQLAVGEGDGQQVTGLAHSLGIIAHELSHGVIQYAVKGGLGVVQVPGLAPALKGEAGALNESFADVFASMIKQWKAGPGAKADWLVGEDIMAPHAGHAIRSLADPGNRELTWAKDTQIKDYRRYLPTDDAHKGAGIASHAFYLAATKIGGNSWEHLGAVWYRALGRLRPRASFLDAAHATIDVAAALHGKGSPPHEAVKAAWRDVYVLT